MTKDGWGQIPAGAWRIADPYCGGVGYGPDYRPCRNRECTDGLIPVGQWRKVSEAELGQIEQARYTGLT